MVEAPGSQSFEMQDIPAIAAVAHAHGALVIDDNTWATPLYSPLARARRRRRMQAATKYIGGHSDVLLGTISANASAWPLLPKRSSLLGVCAGPDDIFLALRGLRTLAVRLAQHHASGLELARWLDGAARGRAVLHPALGDPGHALWKRDFPAPPACSASCCSRPQPAIAALLDALELFGMGFSWGGFESLSSRSTARPTARRRNGRRAVRAAVPYRAGGCRRSESRSPRGFEAFNAA